MRQRPLSPLTLMASAVLIVPAALGQAGSETYRDNAGPGGIYGPVRAVAGSTSASWIELDPATGNTGHLGVCVVSTATPPLESYEILVSARTNSGFGTPHLVYRFDMQGNLLGNFNQDASHANPVSAWGMRDLVADPSGSGVFIGGSEAGFTCQDTTGALVGAFDGNPINPGGAGVQPVTGAAYTAAGGIYRAMAYDPATNTLWSASYGGSLVNFDFDGNLIAPAFSAVGWSAFGLAWDPGSQRLYCNAIPAQGELGIIDPATGTIDSGSIRNLKGGIEGGLSPAPAGDYYGQGWSSGFNVVTLQQSTPFDVVGIQRIDLLTDGMGMVTRRGVDDPLLLSEVNGQGLSMDQKGYGRGDVITAQLVDPAGPNLNPAAIIFNFDIDDIDASSSFPGGSVIPEARALNPFSSPAGMRAAIVSFGFGTTVGPIPISWPVSAGDEIRLQGVYLELLSPTVPVPLAMTNEIHLSGESSIPGILCEALGADSFNSDPSSGFWRVHHGATPSGLPAGDPIASIRLDVSPIPGQLLDTDQISMADRFDGGNSLLAGTCGGTFRVGCDVALGLDYTAGITSPCDPAANTGWTGTVASGNNYRDVSFSFAGGGFGPSPRTFEFDCDTDGAANNGGGQAGAIWTITFQSGAIRTGTLAVDPSNSDRSFVLIQ